MNALPLVRSVQRSLLNGGLSKSLGKSSFVALRHKSTDAAKPPAKDLPAHTDKVQTASASKPYISPRARRLARAKEPRPLPQVAHLTEFPDLGAVDPTLDSKTVTHIPASKKFPYSATVIEHAPYFGLSLEAKRNPTALFSPTTAENAMQGLSEDGTPIMQEKFGQEPEEEYEDDSTREARERQEERKAQYAKLPYPPNVVSKLHRYPLIIKRVVQQTSKGKIPSMYALVVVGNGDGVVGFGQGKDLESAQNATEKAFVDAVKRLDTVTRFEDRTIWTRTTTKLGATTIVMRPRPAGFGLAVNPYLHRVCKAAGIRDLSAKVYGSRNGMQIVKAAMMVLHGGNTPLGLGDGIGGKGKREEAKEGIRSRDMVERERGRKLIEGSGWL